MGYTLKATSRHDVPTTLQRAREELQKEGFGVLTEIDLQAKMKEKLDRDMGAYTILGACAPPLAWDAIHAEMDVGVLLPCNVCVYDRDGTVTVSAMDPEAALSLIEDETVHAIAREAGARLRRAVEATCS